ncbi:hypothetical protein DYQ05_08910 [Treponema pedis]|uniref:Uncharacterized protein n=1 Tax=Treponema pedis TaxID=409322 RepID=A0A7S6WS19_9SPIR|nr:hypothetical protein IFE08_07070 [Treponema pedis]QSI05027.1 hypothetical protein DYQ05_08910 [Treponema pedis]
MLCISISVHSEPSQGAFSVGSYALEVKNVSEQVNAAITNAIFNFVKEQKKYKIFDLRPQKVNESSGDFHYIFTGSITGSDNGIKLELILQSTSDDTKRTISKVYQNANLILLDSRILVSDLFDLSVNLSSYKTGSLPEKKELSSTENEFEEIKNIDILSGSWQGEEGIERIEIMRGGRAVAVLSAGTSIFLQLKISDGYLIITQSGTPNLRQFGNLPDTVAKKAVELGKTPAWKFLISTNNKILSGEKTDINIEYSGDEIVSAKDVIKKVKWFKN